MQKKKARKGRKRGRDVRHVKEWRHVRGKGTKAVAIRTYTKMLQSSKILYQELLKSSNGYTEAYLEPSQILRWRFCEKIVNG